MKLFMLICAFAFSGHAFAQDTIPAEKTRIIVTSDAEIDDECSFVRCLLYSNDFDIEGIISTSSQYHAHDHKWAGDNWYVPYLDAYTEIYPNLIKHDTCYPSPEYLKSITFLGNVETEGDMEAATPGSEHIVQVLLDTSDQRPIWLQAWGGMNTIARALKTIEEDYPDSMAYAASKMRFFFIWEQDETFQTYIRPNWGQYNIPTIISDQFIALFYKWKEYIPAEQQNFLLATWMNENIKINHGPLCSLYKSNDNGDFRSEGDSPSFMHAIPTGLRNLENPGWGGWAGRYTKIRDNIWLDPVSEPGYQYPEGRWYTSTAWGRVRLKEEIPNDTLLIAYLKPIWRWMEAFQNDFASRADWSVKSFEEANHPPVVKLDHLQDLKAMPGDTVQLSAFGTSDPDDDSLSYRWWHFEEADSYEGSFEIKDAALQSASFIVPGNVSKEKALHIICEVTDNGTPQLTRYRRVIVETDAIASPINVTAELIGIDKVELAWENSIEDETGFIVERAEGVSGSFVVAGEGDANTSTYIDSNLNELSLYRYRVSAIHNSLTVVYDREVSVTTLGSTSLPLAISDPVPEHNAKYISIDTSLMWTRSINADSYDVYFGTDFPPSFSVNQTKTVFLPGQLEYDTYYYWQINARNSNGTHEGSVLRFRTDYAPSGINMQNKLVYVQNYPNPFSTSTTFNYELVSQGEVKLTIYNVMGGEICTLVDEYQMAGAHSVTFNAGSMEIGIYFYSLKLGINEQRGKIILVK